MKSTIFRAALIIALALPCTAISRAQNLNIEVANMRQELDMLRQRVGQLEVTADSLQRENTELRNKASAGASASQGYATVDQLNTAIAGVNRDIRDSKADTLSRVKTEMDSLTKQTNTALKQIAQTINTRTSGISTVTSSAPATQPTFSENYSKDGISYTVVSGDSLGKIARKTGAKVEDIKNANRIANEKALMIGQTLFIPGGKDPAAAPPVSTPPVSPVSPAAH